jgi:hypothetical protein
VVGRLLSLLNRYPRIASRLNLAGIAVINDFISVDDGAIFIGMNDADLHIACGVRKRTVTPHALSRDHDSLLQVQCGSSDKECLPRHRQRSEASKAKKDESGNGYTFHGCSIDVASLSLPLVEGKSVRLVAAERYLLRFTFERQPVSTDVALLVVPVVAAYVESQGALAGPSHSRY